MYKTLTFVVDLLVTNFSPHTVIWIPVASTSVQTHIIRVDQKVTKL